MASASSTVKSLSVSKFIYGTTRLGDGRLPVDDRVKMAVTAMREVEWFHTSHQYGDALQVLSTAFEAEPARVPKLILKVGGDTIRNMREIISQQLRTVGVSHMDVGQLCLGGEVAEQFRVGGPILEDLRRLRDEGLVRRWVLEVFPWTSKIPLEAIERGHTDGIIDACIFYLNPLQRFASNPLWDLIDNRRIPVIAMRTVCGAPVHALRDVPGAAWKDYLQKRAVEVAPIFERSGIKSWPEFCARFAFGFPNVIASVGSTAREFNFRELLSAFNSPQPLPADIQGELVALQRRWSDETDVHAEPWTM